MKSITEMFEDDAAFTLIFAIIAMFPAEAFGMALSALTGPCCPLTLIPFACGGGFGGAAIGSAIGAFIDFVIICTTCILPTIIVSVCSIPLRLIASMPGTVIRGLIGI